MRGIWSYGHSPCLPSPSLCSKHLPGQAGGGGVSASLMPQRLETVHGIMGSPTTGIAPGWQPCPVRWGKPIWDCGTTAVALGRGAGELDDLSETSGKFHDLSLPQFSPL